ncbi:hypothetical protein J1605_007473 [Eschrichtius robustus]|uniref:Uncharacterized protein n=1 Tax=Eschrichtius robustus TaxID=9764 RepID=A0AB34H0F3_ESCRO|nr:hypothetical protein J1605_007473 [Eschrichtius robustus]
MSTRCQEEGTREITNTMCDLITPRPGTPPPSAHPPPKGQTQGLTPGAQGSGSWRSCSRPSRRAGPPPHPVDEDTEAEEGTSLGAKFPAGSDTVVSWHRLLTWRRLPGPPPPSQSP